MIRINYDKILSKPKADYTPEELVIIRQALKEEGERLGLRRPKESHV